MSSIFKKPLGDTTKSKPKPKPAPKPEASKTSLPPPPTYATRPPKGHVSKEEEADDQTIPAQPNRPKRGSHLSPLDEEDDLEEEEVISLEKLKPAYRNPFDDRPPRSGRARQGRYDDEHDGDTYDRMPPPSRNTRPRLDQVRHGRSFRDPDLALKDSRRRSRPQDPFSEDPYHGEDLNERRLARMSLNPPRRGEPGPSGSTLARAIATAPSSSVTVVRNPNSPAGDIIAVPKYALVAYSALSASHLSAITSIFNVPARKVADWCTLDLIERDNRTQTLQMDRIFALFDPTFRARWDIRMREDSLGITAQREQEAAQRADTERLLLERDLRLQEKEGRAREPAHRAELEKVKEEARARSRERKREDDKRKEKERQRERERERERLRERDRAREQERQRDRELQVALVAAKKKEKKKKKKATPAPPAPAPAAPTPQPIIINNTQPAVQQQERRRSRSRTRVVGYYVDYPYRYGYYGGGYHRWWW